MDTTAVKACVEDLSNRARPRIEEAKQHIDRINARVAGFVRDNPAACLLGALALGYIVARVARRQH